MKPDLEEIKFLEGDYARLGSNPHFVNWRFEGKVERDQDGYFALPGSLVIVTDDFSFDQGVRREDKSPWRRVDTLCGKFSRHVPVSALLPLSPLELLALESE